MIYTIKITGRLAGLNEYISACRTKAYIGNRMKRDAQTHCEIFIHHTLHGRRIKKPVIIHYRWYEPNRRRDLDNISSFGRKVIQDALVACNVIPNDGWQYVRGFTDEFYVDARNPRIEVRIEEVI